MKRLFIFTMIFMFFSVVYAQAPGEEGVGLPPRHRMHKGGNRRFGKANFWFKEQILEEANIPENLRSKIRLTMHEARKKMFDLGFKIREINIKMKDEFFKENINWKKLRKLNQQSASLKKKQLLIMGNAKIDIMKMLSKQQRKVLLDIIKNRRNKFMKRMFGGPRR